MSLKTKDSFSFWPRLKLIVLKSFNGFVSDECYLRSSALTFYSLLSVVPILAVLFGIAKGFGFERNLQSSISAHFAEQKEITDYFVHFAYSWLETVRGGVIAGVGAVALFWSIFSLLNNIESSLNAIWKVENRTSYIRKFSDYLAAMIVGPILLVVSSSLNLYLHVFLAEQAEKNLIFEALTPLLAFLLSLSPFLISWLLFSFIYLFLPNAKVSLKSALVGGVLAGTAFQIWQAFYFKFQAEVANYGAIYGSFAALPLFLIWLQISWVIFLAGTEVAYAIENHTFSFQSQPFSITRKAAALFLSYLCVESFYVKKESLSKRDLLEETGLSLHDFENVMHLLETEKIIVSVMGEREKSYQPARPLEEITFSLVSSAIERANPIVASIKENSVFSKIQNFLNLESENSSRPLFELCKKE